MRARAIVAVVALVTGVLFGGAPPAGAVGGAGVFASGDIQVWEDLGACATVTFPTPTTFAGEFSVVGAIEGPWTQIVKGVIPFAQVKSTGDSWTGCLPGAYQSATIGEVVYTLVASGANGGEVVHVVTCTVVNGHVSCV